MKKTTILFSLLFILLSCSSENTKEEENNSMDSLNYPESNIWWNDTVFYEIFIRSFYDSNNDLIMVGKYSKNIERNYKIPLKLKIRYDW